MAVQPGIVDGGSGGGDGCCTTSQWMQADVPGETASEKEEKFWRGGGLYEDRVGFAGNCGTKYGAFWLILRREPLRAACEAALTSSAADRLLLRCTHSST